MKAKGNGRPAFILQTYEDRLNNNSNSNKNIGSIGKKPNLINGSTGIKNNELSQKLTERLSDLQNGVTEEAKRPTVTKSNSVNSMVPPPPPPPPPSQTNYGGSAGSSASSTPASSTPSTRSNTLKATSKPPPVPVKYSVLTTSQQDRSTVPKAPPCPTPDYDTLSLASSTASSGNKEAPQPPGSAQPESKVSGTFYQKRTLGGSLSTPGAAAAAAASTPIRRSGGRPVSVTIGEYPTMMRRQPGKLGFLQNGQETGAAGRRGKEADSIGSRLTSELTQTLNRSNLRKRTESMEDLLSESSSSIRTQRNGTVRISLSNLTKAFAKSTSDLTRSVDDDDDDDDDGTDNGRRYNNRVTINVNLTKAEASPSGILKHGSADYATVSGQHRPLTAQKSRP